MLIVARTKSGPEQMRPCCALSLSDADHIDADDDLLQAAQIFVYRGITYWRVYGGLSRCIPTYLH